MTYIENGAIVEGPTAALLSLLLRSPNVDVLVKRLPPWARAYRSEIERAVDAIHRAAAGWTPASEREDADLTGAEVSASVDGVGLSVVAAASVLGLSVRSVQELAAAGRLPARKVGRMWLLDPEAVAVLAKARGRSA